MEKPITERQKRLLVIIYDFLMATGYPPTFEEMRENLGVASNQSVTDLLEKLKRARFIKKESGARSLAILPLGYQILERQPLVPTVGIAAAGPFTEAMEDVKWQQVSPDVAQCDLRVYILRACGDSMVNAGISDGDPVLVQEKKEFLSGDIVHAERDGGATIKRFISEDKPPYVYLKPENPKYENILFTDDVLLKGKVVSVLKGNYWQPVK